MMTAALLRLFALATAVLAASAAAAPASTLGPALVEVGAQAATAAHARALTALDNRLLLHSTARGIDSHDFGFESVMSDSTLQAMRSQSSPTARSNYGSISMVSGSLEVPAFKPWIKVGGSASLTGMHKTGTTVVSGAAQLKIGVDFGFFTLFGFFNGNLYATSHDTHEVGSLVAAVVAEVVAGEAAKPADYFMEAVNWGPHGELSESLLLLEQRRRYVARYALVAARKGRWKLDDEKRFLGMISVNGDSVERLMLELRRHYDEFGQSVTKRVYEAMRRRIRAASRWPQEKQLRKFGGTVAPGAQDKLKRAMDQMGRLIARRVLGNERTLCLRLIKAVEENASQAERTSLLHALVRDVADEGVPLPGQEYHLHMDYRERLMERAANTQMIQRLKELIRTRLSSDVSVPGEAPKRLPELDQARITFDVYGELGVQGTVKVDNKKLPKVKRIGNDFKIEGSLAAAKVPFGLRGEVDLNKPRAADNYRVAYSGRSFAVELILGGFNGLVKVVERDFPSGSTDYVWFVKLFYEHEALAVPGGKGSLTEILTNYAIFANVLHAGRELGGAMSYATSGHISDADPGPIGNANHQARAAAASFDSKAKAMLHSLEGAVSSQQVRDFGAGLAALGVEIVRRQQGLLAGVRAYSTKIQMGAMFVVQVRNNHYKPSEMAKHGGSPLVPNAKAKVAPLFFAQAQAGWDTEENAALGKLPIKGSLKSARGLIAALAV